MRQELLKNLLRYLNFRIFKPFVTERIMFLLRRSIQQTICRQCQSKIASQSSSISSHYFNHEPQRCFSATAWSMSGHSKWSKVHTPLRIKRRLTITNAIIFQIKHDKGAKDAKRANAFSKIVDEIIEYTKR